MGRSRTTEIKVRWGETDAMGIVFYPTYFAWFDHATHELFGSSGRNLATILREEGISVPIAECGARFRAPTFAGDEVAVTATVGELQSRSFRVEHRVERAGREVASGFEVRVVARLEADGRLAVVPMPDPIREWLAGEEPADGPPAQ
jgi:YbgC/YbaW family acyl-CoA thioester hydrolase